MALDKTTIMLLLLSAILAINLYQLKITIEGAVKSNVPRSAPRPPSKGVPVPLPTAKAVPVLKPPEKTAETTEIHEDRMESSDTSCVNKKE